MISTTDFFIWFFNGLAGFGGWLIFFLVALISALYVFLDSNTRKLPVSGWRISIVLVSMLILPVAIHHFLSITAQARIASYLEYFFYLGMVGGIVPPFMLVGYIVQYRGMVICDKGHLYPRTLEECPECIPADFAEYDSSELDETQLDLGNETDTHADGTLGVTQDNQTILSEKDFFDIQFGKVGFAGQHKSKANAFLVFSDNHSYQLNQGSTTIGRGSSNDCVIQNPFISRNHVKIMEEGRNLFRIYDLGSSNGTWLNGRKLMKATLLENDDQIRFGDEVTAVFLSSRNY